MIDFRYHVVSLVAVFLALAVGVVLGAGPLDEEISSGITDQVADLRDDRQELRAQADAATAALQHRDAFVREVTPALVGQRLAGSRAVLVALPGAADETVQQTADALRLAGAEVTGTVAVGERWTDPEQSAFRESLATQFATYLPQGPSSIEGPDALLAALLARALVTPDAAAATAQDPDAATVLEGLRGGELVTTTDGDLAGRATLAAVVAPGPAVVEAAATADADEADEADEAASRARAWATLAAALDAGSSGAVVLGPLAATAEGGLLDVVRSDDAVAAVVSSVDEAGAPTGAVAAVLALREQLAGGVGHYGYGEDAVAPAPDLPAADAAADPAAEPAPSPEP